MARLPRYCLPDYPQHVIQRGKTCSNFLVRSLPFLASTKSPESLAALLL